MRKLGRGRYIWGTYPVRNRTGVIGLERWDTIRETVTVAAQATTAAAAAAPAIPRNLAGDPLEVTFPSWVSGSYLRVDWAGSAFGTLTVGASGFLVPRVLIAGSPDGYLDNGSQLGLVGVPGILMYAFGSAVVQLNTTAAVTVQLGIVLIEGAPGDNLVLPGGPMDLSVGPPVAGSTWIRGAMIPQGLISAPPAVVSPLPIPS